MDVSFSEDVDAVVPVVVTTRSASAPPGGPSAQGAQGAQGAKTQGAPGPRTTTAAPAGAPHSIRTGPGELVDLQFTLPSDRNWRNRNYFKLVEKQRALGATPMASARDV